MYSDTDSLLAQHPAIETVEALITDCNGAARGKWLPIEKLPSLLSEESSCPSPPLRRIFGGAMCHGLPSITATSMAVAGPCPLPGARPRARRH